MDLRNLLLGFALFLSFADFAFHTSIGHINLGLIEGSFVSFTAEECEVLATRGVLQLFNIGVVSVLELLASAGGAHRHPVVSANMGDWKP